MKTLHEKKQKVLEYYMTELSNEIDVCIDYVEDINDADSMFDYYMTACYEQEIIYYSDAINYLRINDPSLHDSLELAAEYDYVMSNISSEVLATLLYQNELSELLCKVDFNALIEELNELEELESEVTQ